jgi:hypothetical protein
MGWCWALTVIDMGWAYLPSLGLTLSWAAHLGGWVRRRLGCTDHRLHMLWYGLDWPWCWIGWPWTGGGWAWAGLTLGCL